MAEMDDSIPEWEEGLPGPEELTPLSQMLITPELACAFRISPEPCRTLVDVSRASQNTISSLRRHNSAPAGSSAKGFAGLSNNDKTSASDLEAGDGLQDMPDENSDGGGSGAGKNPNRNRELSSAAGEEADSSANGGFDEDQSARTLKRPRLVWTPQLHKRFVDVVAHLGIKNAVPKTIMQLMNVEGLTRENVASHLQKYRLYLKRMQGHSNDGAGASDNLFASTPMANHMAAGPAFRRDEHPQMPMGTVPVAVPMQMPYSAHMVQMPVFGMASHGHGHLGAPMHSPNAVPPPPGASASYSRFDPYVYVGATFGMPLPPKNHSADGDRMETSSSYRTAAANE